MTKSTSLTNTVKHHRLLRGITQEQLANQLGVSRQTVVAIEGGKYSPTLEYAFRLSRILGFSIEELFQYPELQEETHVSKH